MCIFELLYIFIEKYDFRILFNVVLNRVTVYSNSCLVFKI